MSTTWRSAAPRRPRTAASVGASIVGGAGTLLGPILGSFILSPLAEVSRAYFQAGGWSGAHLIMYGGLLIAVVLFLPQGAYPFIARHLGLGRR